MRFLPLVYCSFLFGLTLIAGCRLHEQKKRENPIIDLNVSTKIILKLIHDNRLKSVLEENAKPEEIELLIKNFSPAVLAFESDVLNCSIPVVIIFFKRDDNWENLKLNLEKLAEEYKDRIRFVQIDADELFSLAKDYEIDVFPTISIMHQREEIERFENLKDFERLPIVLDALLQKN